jgi:hypothetical protein
MASSSEFSFAFNNEDFSDRTLVLRAPEAKGEAKNRGQKRKAESLEEEEQESVKRLKVNSMLLSARSEFFQALFTNKMKDRTEKELLMEVRKRTQNPRIAARF